MRIQLDMSSAGPVRATVSDDGPMHLRLGPDVFEAMAGASPHAAEQLREVASVLRDSGGEVDVRLATEEPPFNLAVDVETGTQ